PQLALRRPVLLAAWAAVAITETICEIAPVEARIKWPNDVLLDGRKVCGILIEQSRGTVAGIGLNVNQTAEAFAAAGLPEATALAQFTRTPLDVTGVARVLLNHLDLEYDRLCSGDLSNLETRWKERTGLLGKQVRVECHDRVHRGLLLDMAWDGLMLDVGE